jgi:acetyl-CoA C-acetyltransferase
VVVGYEGPVEIETWTVMHERDTSMARAHAALLTPDGRRAWGATNDPEVMAAMEVDDFAGRAASRASDGTLTF